MSYDSEKYRPGLKRYPIGRIAHLYETEGVMDFGWPMCIYGWTDSGRDSYSILRNNVGDEGICQRCVKRAEKGLKGVEPRGYDPNWVEPDLTLTPEEQAQVDAVLGHGNEK